MAIYLLFGTVIGILAGVRMRYAYFTPKPDAGEQVKLDFERLRITIESTNEFPDGKFMKLIKECQEVDKRYFAAHPWLRRAPEDSDTWPDLEALLLKRKFSLEQEKKPHLWK